MKPYRIHIGFTHTGRDRWRYFATLEAASKACRAVFNKTGIVLSVTTTPNGGH